MFVQRKVVGNIRFSSADAFLGRAGAWEGEKWACGKDEGERLSPLPSSHLPLRAWFSSSHAPDFRLVTWPWWRMLTNGSDVKSIAPRNLEPRLSPPSSLKYPGFWETRYQPKPGSFSFSLIRSDEGLALETSAIVSFTASITLVNTQLIHQFVFLAASITLVNT